MIGYAAMAGNAFGSQNVAVGFKAMSIFEPYTFYSGEDPSRNVAVGDSALQSVRGNNNTGIGFKALVVIILRSEILRLLITLMHLKILRLVIRLFFQE